MWIFNIFDRYLGKSVFITIITALFVLVSLSGIIKFVDQLKKTGQGTYDTIGAGIYTLLSIPKDLQLFFPMATLLGVLVGLGILAQRGELIVMQAAGFTNTQIVLSVIKTIIPLVFLILAVGEWIAPQGEKIAYNYRLQAMYGRSMYHAQHGLWIKDGNNFIYIEEVKNNNELRDISIYKFNNQHHLQSVCYAATAKFDFSNNIWHLSQVNESDFTKYKQITGSQMLFSTWKPELTPDNIAVLMLPSNSLSLKDLYKHVEYLKDSNQYSGYYRLNMWNKILQPVSIAAMIFMAISFVFGPLCRMPIDVRVAIGVLFSFIFYALEQIFHSLILVYNLPIIIGTLLPSIVFFIMSLFFLLKRF